MSEAETTPLHYRIIQRVVIRGRDPREPTPGLLKIEAAFLSVGPAILNLVILHRLGASQEIQVAATIVLAGIWMKIVSAAINERIEELEKGSMQK